MNGSSSIGVSWPPKPSPSQPVGSITGGTGIAVTGTAVNPIVSNTGVISVTAGTNVTLGGTAANPIINASGGGGSAVESFAIALSADFNTGGTGFEAITAGFTDTVNTITFPAIAPGILYQNLTTGALNLGTGEFTVGTTGQYSYYMTIGLSNGDFSPGLSIAGPLAIVELGSSTPTCSSGAVSLTSGQVVRAFTHSAAPAAVDYTSTIYGFLSYNLTWGMTLIK
jgi:hypothetical protein